MLVPVGERVTVVPGATPGGVLGLVLGDAARIGLAATAIALVAGIGVLSAFAAAGLLAPFGVRLSPVPAPGILLVIAAAALCVALASATLATLGLVRDAPATLLSDDRARGVPGETDD